MNISFQRALIEDVDELIRVQNNAFRDDYVEYGECPSYEETSTKMESHIINDIVYKIMDDNKIIGDIQIKKNEGNKYYLRVICIIKEYQGYGIGQEAIKYIEDENNEAKEWSLITPFKSIRNHHFYEKMGYLKVGEYRHSDVLIMFQYKKIKEKY